ncbi:MAG: AI-2E family transporter [Bacteroidota bacterium]
MPRPKKKNDVVPSVHPTEIHQTKTFDVAVVIAAFVLLILMLYSIQSLLSPFLIFGSIIFLLYPLRANPVSKNLMGLTSLLFILWLLHTLQGILAPFVLSLFMAYLLHPLVTKVERVGVPRWTSALFIILCFVALIIILLLVGLPHIIAQFEGILQAITVISSQFIEWVLNGQYIKILSKYGISSTQLREMLTTTIAPRVEVVLNGILHGTFGLVSGLQGIVAGIVNIVIVPFLTFYMLKDFPLVRLRIKLMIPRNRREQSVKFYHRVDEILGRYIRGTTIIAIVDAICVTIGMSIIGISYPIVLGILSGLLFFIPYVGFLTILSVTAFVASLSMGTIPYPVISSLSFLGVLHIVENYVVTPKVIGGKIGLHPVVLILSLFIFGYFLGFIGLLIAIPAAAIIIVSVKEWEANRRNNDDDIAAETGN